MREPITSGPGGPNLRDVAASKGPIPPSPAVRGIAWLEVVGGVIGGLSIGWFHLLREGKPFDETLQLRLLPFAILTTGGLGLLKSKRIGLHLSVLMQAAQALAWQVGGTTWRFCAGPFIALTLFWDKTSIYGGWDSTIAWGKSSVGAPGFVSLNLISLPLWYILWRHLRSGASHSE